MTSSLLTLTALLVFVGGELPAPGADSLDLQQLLKNIKWDKSHYAASVHQLEQLAADHIPDFYAALADKEVGVYSRGVVLRVLCELRPRPQSLEPTLSSLAFDPSLPVVNRKTVVVGIPVCFPPVTAIPLLRRALSSAETEIRQGALRTLSWLKEDALPLLPLLLQLSASDPNEEVRCWSAESVEAMGPRRVEALPALRNAAATEQNVYVRNCLQETIGIIEKGLAR